MKGTRIGIKRTHQYYRHKQPDKDWTTKQMIEEALREHPGYGHKRLALHLKINKKRVLRVMKLFGIKPYRRYVKKPFVYKTKDSIFSNLLMFERPRGRGDIYASDFTYIKFQGRWLYVGTVIDLFTREVVGVSALRTHNTQLVLNTLGSSLLDRPPPRIIHSDQGSEYKSKDFGSMCQSLGIIQSMSAPGCPWENGYQESFYKGFKIELGDPNRFDTLGELVAEIYKVIHYYNKRRIHSALKMAPSEFAQKQLIR